MDDRIPQSPPVIKPLETGIVRPLWSVMIPTYNCARYLKQTLESVLIQDPGIKKMQIELLTWFTIGIKNQSRQLPRQCLL